MSAPPPATPNALDPTDLQLLAVLAQDGRVTNAALAERVGIAPSTCLARVRALRASGVIRGFHADLDLAALGRPLEAIIAIRLTVHEREQINAFTEHVTSLRGVLSVFHMTGGDDYLLHVAARDMQHLRELVVDELTTHAAVAHAQSSLVYERRRGPGVLGALDVG